MTAAVPALRLIDDETLIQAFMDIAFDGDAPHLLSRTPRAVAQIVRGHPSLELGLPYGFFAADGTMIATATARETEYDARGDVSLFNIAVRADRRATGVGTQMMHALFTALTQAGFRRVLLATVRPGTFYDRCGMQEFGRLEEQDGTIRRFYARRLAAD